MSPPSTTLQYAVFERFTDGTSWTKLSKAFEIEEHKIRHAYAQWMRDTPASQPVDSSDIHLPTVSSGRPRSLSSLDESLVKSAILYFAKNNTRLNKEGLLDMVQHYVGLMPQRNQQEINFKNNRPSLQWLQSFLTRQELSYKSVRMIDDKRIEAVTQEHLAEHIARMRGALKRYNIRDGSRILNMDQSGVSFSKTVGRSLRKGVGNGDTSLVQKTVRVKGNLDQVTIMPIVSANGRTFIPVIVFPGGQAHFRKANGTVTVCTVQTIHEFLPECYFYQREIPGVDSAIIYDWAKKLVQETKHLRQSSDAIGHSMTI